MKSYSCFKNESCLLYRANKVFTPKIPFIFKWDTRSHTLYLTLYCTRTRHTCIKLKKLLHYIINPSVEQPAV